MYRGLTQRPSWSPRGHKLCLNMFLLPALVIVMGFILFRVLKFTDRSVAPVKLCADTVFMRAIIDSCPILFGSYDPPLLWGRSGHLQTLIGAKFGRLNPPDLSKTHHSLALNDGATVTFDVFEPQERHQMKDHMEIDTIIVVPGIANCSDTKYVRTFAGYATRLGFRVAVLNHLGTNRDLKLTAPRIFTYGGTDELDAMVTCLLQQYQCSQLIGVGFSMGGNIMLKYLGEAPERQKKFLCAVSVCQGYDIVRAKPLLKEWDGIRRFYNWGITQTMTMLIRHHASTLFNCTVEPMTSIEEFDEVYTRKMTGFDYLENFYKRSSCCNVMHRIDLPVLLLNSLDDPLVPEQLLAVPEKHVRDNTKALFVMTRHGGHLGFFEGGVMAMSSLTWLDKAVMEYIIAVRNYESQ